MQSKEPGTDTENGGRSVRGAVGQKKNKREKKIITTKNEIQEGWEGLGFCAKRTDHKETKETDGSLRGT